MLKGLAAICVACVLLVGCGSDKKDAGESSSTTVAPTTTVAVDDTLRILVTNDDGYNADGIDAVVEALRKLPKTEVTVVAPAENQTLTGGKTTPGEITAKAAKTKSGYPAQAVDGFPADTITWAIDQEGIPQRPHVVISGINIGQNMGTSIDLSGTIGAARAAARSGIPALATSQGISDNPDWPAGVKATLAWLAEHRDELLARDTSSTTPATVTNLNTPTCPTGTPRPVVILPVGGAQIYDPSDCVTPYPNPKADVDAFLHGYIVQTDNLTLEPLPKQG